jgi:heterotetrameric sarcosine oxidase gamma subunit
LSIPKECGRVVDIGLLPNSGFSGLAQPGRYGRSGQWAAPVTLQERPGLRFVQIAVSRDNTAKLSETVRASTGLELPDGPKRVAEDGLALIGLAPGQWQAVAEDDDARQRLASLTQALAGIAATVDISDSKAVMRIAGPSAREVLAKGCQLDLHCAAFAPGDAARTAISLIPCQLWQVNVTPAYDIAVELSYAASFWHWLTASAAEFGYEVVAASSD